MIESQLVIQMGPGAIFLCAIVLVTALAAYAIYRNTK